MSDAEICFNHQFRNREYEPWQTKPYSPNKVRYIQTLYILAIIVWIAIILLLRLYEVDIVGYLILFLPLIIFAVGYYNASVITPEVEDIVFQANYLSVGLIVVIPLFTWISKGHREDTGRFLSIVTLAIILAMISLFDFWVKRGWMSVVKHSKSVLQTYVLALFVLAFYLFYAKAGCDMFI